MGAGDTDGSIVRASAAKNLIAPLWSADKKTVINAISHAFERDSIMQGRHYT